MGNSQFRTDSSTTVQSTTLANALHADERRHGLHDSHTSPHYLRENNDVNSTARTGQKSSPNDADGVAEVYNLSKPTAAVIGAGIAGVHVAYELADLGFDVTVFDKHAQPAMGETLYTLPFVGIGYREPALTRLRIGRDFVRELVFSTAASCPSLITGDHRLGTAFSPVLHRWLWSRTRSVFREEEVMWYTNNLSRLSVHVVQELLRKYPQLNSFVYPDPVQLGRVVARSARTLSSSSSSGGGGHTRTNAEQTSAEPSQPQTDSWEAHTANSAFAEAIDATSSSTRWVASPSAHPAARQIDPVGWTRALADICQRDYGVTFLLQERVDDFHVHLRAAQEMTDSLRSSHAHPTLPGQRVYRDHRFDVIVISAGAESGWLTWRSGRLPILGLTGWQAWVQQPRGALSTALKSLLPPPSDVTQGAETTLTPHAWPRAALSALAPACSLYAYTAPLVHRVHAQPEPSASAASAPSTSSPSSLSSFTMPAITSSRVNADAPKTESTRKSDMSCCITGLLSLDTTSSATEQRPDWARAQLTRLEDYLRVWCRVEVPLTPVLDSRVRADSLTNADSSTDATLVGVQRYVRAFAPDGLPIVDRCGGVYNTFICSGFGDHAGDFAPGAAKMLRSVVERQALVIRETDRHRLQDMGMMLMHSLPSARAAVEQRMRLLTLGILPAQCPTHTQQEQPQRRQQKIVCSDSSVATVLSDAEIAASSGAVAETTRPGCYNPFCTDRFTNMVTKENADSLTEAQSSDSCFARMRQWESNLVTVTEAAEQKVRSWAIGAVTSEHAPDWIRRAVHRWVADVEDNTEVWRVHQRYAETMRQLAEMREAPHAFVHAREGVCVVQEKDVSAGAHDATAVTSGKERTMSSSGTHILDQSKNHERDMQERARNAW